jgi:hypothetical protein
MLLQTYVNAVNATLSWIKIFKYLNFFPNMRILTSTLKVAARPLLWFTIVFVIVILGAGQVSSDDEIFSTTAQPLYSRLKTRRFVPARASCLPSAWTCPAPPLATPTPRSRCWGPRANVLLVH